jgi:SAM-dependent methyltransferase
MTTPPPPGPPAPAAGPGTAASPPPAGPGAHHDWHSREYVGEWIRGYESRLESRRPQFDLLAALIPRAPDAPLRLLDLGGGWGPVTRHLLERFPAASAVLLDYSEVMLEEASRRLAHLAGRVRFVRGDLSSPGAIERAAAEGGPAGQPDGAPFDAVVTSLCLHNLRPTERLPALFAEVRAALAPGGCFLDVDLMGSTPLLQRAWHNVQIERLRAERHAQTGVLPAREEIEAELRAGRERRAGRTTDGPPPPPGAGATGPTRTLADHLLWLREAGFDAVDCFWRQERHAIVGGFVAPAA